MSATIDLNLVRYFVSVHQAGGFSAAAAKLRVPRSTVSRAVTALEDATGLLLFHRTTRSVTTTREGLALYDRVEPWLERLERSLRDLPEATPAPAGLLRVTTSSDLGALVFAEAVARYTTRYPDTRVEAVLTARTVNLAKEGFDLALRFASGSLTGSFVARKLGSVSLQLFAAPDYLSRRGTPKSTADLGEHDMVVIGGAKGALPGTPRVVADDKHFARAVLRAGGGIGLLPTYLVSEDLVDGRLVRVLPSFEAQTGTIYLVIPSKKHLTSKVTAFRDLLVELFRQR